LAREEGASQGYESSSEESVEEENNLVGRDMEEEPFPEQEGASVEGQSQDVRNEARKNAHFLIFKGRGPIHHKGSMVLCPN
jgi:hypothetical protein